ncbi:MAG: YciI family protein [Kofleriaceae bacterium]
MRFMVLVKANAESEQAKVPNRADMREMGKFNQQLIDAGVLLDANGLKASKFGARIELGGGKPRVIDGPFAEAKELVAGYWIWQCKDLDEAIAWAKRCPDPHAGGGQLEIRPIWELSEIPE